MQHIVTGASGFIGSNLCHKLIQSGHNVIGLSNTTKDIPPILANVDSKQFKMINCNLIDEKKLYELAQDVGEINCLFHLAGQTFKKNSIDSQLYFHGNVTSTLNVLELCNKLNVKKIVFASSIAVYGLGAGQGKPLYLPVDEKHETKPSEFYGYSKYLGEQLCKYYSENYGISANVFRISRVYGPGLNKGLIFIATKNALSNLPITVNGDISTDFVFIEDVINMMFESCKNNSQFEIFNLGGGEETTLHKVCSEIINLTKSNSKINFNPQPSSKFSLDISKAKKNLNYTPKQLKQGLIKEIEYVRELSN